MSIFMYFLLHSIMRPSQMTDKANNLYDYAPIFYVHIMFVNVIC